MLTSLNISEIKEYSGVMECCDYQVDEDMRIRFINDEYKRDEDAEKEKGNNSLGYFDLDECSIRIRFWPLTENMDITMKTTEPITYNAHILGQYKEILTSDQKARTERNSDTCIFDGTLYGNKPGILYIIFNPYWKDFDSIKFCMFLDAPKLQYFGFPTITQHVDHTDTHFYFIDIKDVGFYYKLDVSSEYTGTAGVYLFDVLDPEGNIMFGMRRNIDQYHIEHDSVTVTTNGDESRYPFCHIEENKAYIPNKIPLDIWTLGKPDEYGGNVIQGSTIPHVILPNVVGGILFSVAFESNHNDDTFLVINNYKSPSETGSLVDIVNESSIRDKEKYFFFKYPITTQNNWLAIQINEKGIGYSKYEIPVQDEGIKLYDFDYQPNNCRRNWGIRNKWYSLLCDAMWNDINNVDTANYYSFSTSTIENLTRLEGIYYSKNYLNLV